MISKKQNFILILSSIILTVIIIFVYLFIYTYSSLFGTNGQDTIGLKYEISMKQIAVQEIKSIEEPSKKEKFRKADIRKADISIKPKKKKKKSKKLQKPKKFQKQVYDKATVGKINLIYAKSLQSAIKRNMISPTSLQSTKKVFVRFRINGNGAIAFSNIHKSSGLKSLDKLALETVRISSPFQRPPIFIRKTDMIYIIPLIYKLKN